MEFWVRVSQKPYERFSKLLLGIHLALPSKHILHSSRGKTARKATVLLFLLSSYLLDTTLASGLDSFHKCT